MVSASLSASHPADDNSSMVRARSNADAGAGGNRANQLNASPRMRHRAAHLFHRRHETISESRPRFDEARIARRIAQRAPQSVHGGIQAAVETHVHAGPKKLRQIVAHHQLAWSLQQEFENLKRLALQFDADAVFAQFPVFEIHLEGSKT